MSDAIYVLVDHSKGQISTPSLETLVVGQQLSQECGWSLHALVLGQEIRSLGEQVAGYACQSVILMQDDKLAGYDPDFHAAALAQILDQDQPRLLLMGHIYQNIDLAPKLAAAVNTALVTDCTGYRRKGQELFFIRQMFASKLQADVAVRSRHPWIVSVQAGARSADDLAAGQSKLEERAVDLSQVSQRRQALEAFEAVKGKVDLSKAEVIVAVGRGIKKQENMKLIEDLAQVLGAEIGASRPVVDNEWLDRDRQIGSSGQTVTPRLYVACGLSGAIQHLVGMKNSGCVVAVNTDPNAPIFNVATYGIVGDLFEIVPALTRKLREEKGE